jgi:restriction system protein
MEGDMGSIPIPGAFIPVMLLSILVLSVLYFFKSPWFKGVVGEMKVHISAKIHLNRGKYHILRNVTLPTTDGTTQIDHVIVSQYGVFVIETKNMKGWIFGGARQKTWTQKIFKYTKKFQNPLHQNYKHVETLKSLLELTEQQIFSVVVFVGRGTFKTEMPNNVINGPELIRYIKSKDRPVILGTDVPMIVSKIEAERLVSSRETTKAHINHVKNIIAEKQTRYSSPESERSIAVRNAKNGGKRKQLLPDYSRAPESNGILDAPEKNDEMEFSKKAEPLSTDSWGERTWRDDEIEPAFMMDRAFR